MNLKTCILTVSFFTLASCATNAEPNREDFHKAKEACFTETGVTRPERGMRPSKEDRLKIKLCLKNKGFKKPTRGRRFGG